MPTSNRPPESFLDKHGSDDGTTPSDQDDDQRDEVKEIQKMSQADNARVMKLRFAVTLSLLLTGVAATATTLLYLRRSERRDFETAFDQFASTIRDSAIRQQVNLREGYRGLASLISGYVASSNSTWPFVDIKGWEEYARNARKQTKLELFSLFPLVKHQKREQYEEFVTENIDRWAADGHRINPVHKEKFTPTLYRPFLSKRGPDGFVEDDERDEYAPLILNTPPSVNYLIFNWNYRSVPDYDQVVGAIKVMRNETLATRIRSYVAVSEDEHDSLHTQGKNGRIDHPHSFMAHPINRVVGDDQSEVVGILSGAMAWDVSMRNLLPDAVSGICCTIRNNCGQVFSYSVEGKEAYFLGNEDHCHRKEFSHMAQYVNLSTFDRHPNFAETPGHCLYTMSIYPGKKFQDAYDSDTPEIFAAAVALTFLGIAVIFFFYDLSVQRRNRKLIEKAAHSNSIVASMFPGAIRDRLIGPNQDSITNKESGGRGKQKNLKAFMVDSNRERGDRAYSNKIFHGSRPLAELYIDTTILFGDIVGFTAWSSVREPTQVFQLLETVYGSFDVLAKRQKVFKVETVGDCYVAATGIPNPIKNHATKMLRFGYSIINKINELSRELEVTLGPDTGDLSLRVGVHTGPVTAGVLRGDRARFQLFGDTMNVTARIESSGTAGRIHVSQAAADSVVKAGYGSWIVRRKERVEARGKGEIQTYWVRNFGLNADERGEPQALSDVGSVNLEQIDEVVSDSDERNNRLIDWNVGVLQNLIKCIVARRRGLLGTRENEKSEDANFYRYQEVGSHLEEVREIITLPDFDAQAAQSNVDDVELSPEVIRQLRELVVSISELYRQNSFHSFEHASHVTMSVLKLLSRIVAPQDLDTGDDTESEDVGWKVASTLHDHTYGITSDPLTQFACAFSALIHDADHTGVPNAQLVKESADIVKIYGGRSVAEQNSLDLAWMLLSNDKFDKLRAAICATESELDRFRQLVVNCVMATDISDKELGAARKARWAKAFQKSCSDKAIFENERDVVNRKATIVIEHLIQASDVAHTMQHWHVYRKWNERLFHECYAAYANGRAETDPSEGWFEGEIGFFDFYIIPLAKKLKDCGVFGVSSDEYLTYAKNNRAEWEARGQDIVAEMTETVRQVAAVQRERAE